jgi:Na+/H+-translocating membrane pyrophosphatase
LGVSSYVAGVFGTAVATMGMLMPAAFILAMATASRQGKDDNTLLISGC